MATLYDAYGRPIQRDVLAEELSGPTTTGVRTPFSGHPAQGLTPERLAAILLSAEQGDAEAYLELAEEMEEKDLHYRSVLATRKLQVAGLDITVEAASDNAEDVRAADLVRDMVAADILQGALFDVLDAVGKGYSVCEILWDTEGRQWMPRALAWRDPRWFGFERANGTVLNLRGETGLLVALTPAKFVTHIHKSKSGLPIRGGLARAASWSYLFKNFDLKSWVLFCEVYGHPLRVGKYGKGATEEDRRTLLRAVRSVAADHAAIIPDSMLIDFVDAKAQGNAQVFERLVDYLDKQVSKAVLGQTGTTDAGSRVGTADAHERVRADIETSDAVQLSATLNRDLIRPLVDLNFGPRRRYPILRVFRPKKEDISALVDNLVKLLPHTESLAEVSYVRDKLGIPEPATGAACLGREQKAEVQAPESRERAAAKAAHSTVSIPNTPAVTDAPAKDGIDRLVEAILNDEGWQPLVAPLADPIFRAAEKTEDPDVFLESLPAVLTEQDPAALADKLAQAMFIIQVLHEQGKDV